jgi:hypothetical protein
VSGAREAGRHALAIALIGALGGVALGACAARGAAPSPSWQAAQQRRDEVTALWTQIRDWRRAAQMDLEPAGASVLAMAPQTVDGAGAVCPDAYVPPPACDDVCGLADAICENAEVICDIAAELAPDPWAEGKCDSAKASCHEAQARCCDCEPGATPATAPESAPAGLPPAGGTVRP